MEATTRITGVEMRGEWFRVTTESGLRLDTKRGEIADKARQSGGQPVTVVYTERQSQNINPHTGQAFLNRYLEDVLPVGSPPPETSWTPNGTTTAATPAPAPATPMVSADDRGAKAGRNNIAAAAVETLLQLGDGSKEYAQALLDGLARWSEFGTPVFSVSPTTTSTAAVTPTFDDIPF